MTALGRFLTQAAGVLTAAAAVGAAVLGAAAIWLDILSHFALIWLAAGVTAAVVAALLRAAPLRRFSLACSAVAIVAASVLMAPELFRTTGPTASAGAPAQIKVIQLNARRSNGDIQRIADWLTAQEADVVTVTEARHDLRDLLVSRTGWRMAGAHGDLIIFTRERYLMMDRPRVDAGLAYVNATYASASGRMELATTHVGWPVWPETPGQIRGLKEVIRQLPRERLILTGDFNLTPWSRDLRGLEADLGLIRRDRAVPTWPARMFGRDWPLPFLPIDHVYAGPGWATVRVERGPNVGSDHYPLIVTLAPVAPR